MHALLNPKYYPAQLRPFSSAESTVLRRSDRQHAAVPQSAREVRRAAVRPAAVAPRVCGRDRRIAVAAVVVDEQVHLARGLVVPVRRGPFGLRANVGAAAAGASPSPVQPCRRILHKDVLERLILEEAEVGVLVAASVGKDIEVDDVGWCSVDVGCWCAERLEVAGVC